MLAPQASIASFARMVLSNRWVTSLNPRWSEAMCLKFIHQAVAAGDHRLANFCDGIASGIRSPIHLAIPACEVIYGKTSPGLSTPTAPLCFRRRHPYGGDPECVTMCTVVMQLRGCVIIEGFADCGAP